MGESLRIGTFISVNLIINPLVYCFLKNFNFLVLKTAHIDQSIILPSLVLTTFAFTFFIFSILETIR